MKTTLPSSLHLGTKMIYFLRNYKQDKLIERQPIKISTFTHHSITSFTQNDENTKMLNNICIRATNKMAEVLVHGYLKGKISITDSTCKMLVDGSPKAATDFSANEN